MNSSVQLSADEKNTLINQLFDDKLFTSGMPRQHNLALFGKGTSASKKWTDTSWGYKYWPAVFKDTESPYIQHIGATLKPEAKYYTFAPAVYRDFSQTSALAKAHTVREICEAAGIEVAIAITEKRSTAPGGYSIAYAVNAATITDETKQKLYEELARVKGITLEAVAAKPDKKRIDPEAILTMNLKKELLNANNWRPRNGDRMACTIQTNATTIAPQIRKIFEQWGISVDGLKIEVPTDSEHHPRKYKTVIIPTAAYIQLLDKATELAQAKGEGR